MEALGIDLTWFLFQMGNFIVLFGGLTYLLHKPLLKLLESRRLEIEAGLENAEQVKLELASTQERQGEILEEARKNSAALLQETKQKASNLESQLLATAEAKAEQFTEKAHQELLSEREQLRSELRGELAQMVVKATSKILEQDVPKEKQDELSRKVNNLES